MNKKLRQVLQQAYLASIGKATPVAAQAQFMGLKDDAEFIEAARSELARASQVPDQCFIAKQHAAFLKKALAELDAH